MSRFHLGFCVALMAAIWTPLCSAAPVSLSGVVQNSAGEPQIGAVVQLLKPDLSVLNAVYTDERGRFSFVGVAPGRYAVKAIATSFLPSLRENVRVRRTTFVNLTLNTLYEVMQWLPAQPKAANARKDDWAWTLRSAANRPLLRWLEDGPLVVVSDGTGHQPKLKARLIATGREGTFGESGERITASVQDTPADSRELLASVDFAPGSDAGMESMLGFSQDLGFAGSVQSVAAIAVHPEVESATSGGLDEATIHSSEVMHVGSDLEVEVGADQVFATMMRGAGSTWMGTFPYTTVSWTGGRSSVHYGMRSLAPSPDALDPAQVSEWMPAFLIRNGSLTVEQGLHQEIGWQRQTTASRISIGFFSDSVQNPMIEAAAGFDAQAAPDMLYDQTSGLIRMAGPGYTDTGFVASVEHRASNGNAIRFSYANGTSLVMPALPRSVPVNQILAGLHPRRVQTYSLSLSGTLEGTGTRWTATYRWQPTDAETTPTPFAPDNAAPYLTLHLRQPIHERAEGSGGIDALLNVSNLLAEGYRPYLLPDGSTLIFAQGQRAIAAGVAFTF